MAMAELPAMNELRPSANLRVLEDDERSSPGLIGHGAGVRGVAGEPSLDEQHRRGGER